MTRSILDASKIHPQIQDKIASNRKDIVDEVKAAVERSPIVVVGMAQNPHCKKARKALQQSGQAFEYLEVGSYLKGWRRRTALKMWTGWPTFPMVFVKGTLVGGASDVKALIDAGELSALLG